MNEQIQKLLDLKLPSPVEEITYEGYTFSCKRDDLIHPVISGNKWRKLYYHLQHYFERGYQQIASFGGAYSNHLYALSHVCAALKIPLTAFVRGDGFDPENSTLQKMRSDGTNLMFIDRSSYRLKEEGNVVKTTLNNLNHCMLVPEGGSGLRGRKGIEHLCEELNWQDINHIVVSAGTGATAAGLFDYIARENLDVTLHVVSALKGAFMQAEIIRQLSVAGDDRLQVYHDYHFGGYGKMPAELKIFQNKFQEVTGIELDLVYNAKSVYAMMDMLKAKKIHSEEGVLYINTGGLRI
jgi:1-aminocyclopropane-1-carboxylate deaminase